MKGIPAMGAHEKGNLTNVVNPLHQEFDDHSLIIALQKQIHSLKQRNAQEMEDLQKENVSLRE